MGPFTQLEASGAPIPAVARMSLAGASAEPQHQPQPQPQPQHQPQRQRLSEVLLQVTADKKQTSSWGVSRRLKTAAALLERQTAKDSVALLREAETLDSVVKPLHRAVVPERLIELSIQLFTITALCAFSLAAGIIVGTVVSRTSLTLGMQLLTVTSVQNQPQSQLIVPDSAGAPQEGTNTTAVFRARFIVTLPLRNMGALVESLGLFVEVLYIPSGGLPSAAECFSATNAFISQAPVDTENSYSTTQAAAELLGRGRENYTLVTRGSVHTDIDVWQDTDGVTFFPVQLSFLRRDARMQALLGSSLAPAAPGISAQQAVGVTSLAANSVPFIPGLKVGLDSVSLQVGLNLPLEAQDAPLKEAFTDDCTNRRKVFMMIRFPTVAVSSMFVRLSHQPFTTGIFTVACNLSTLSAKDWPPETPQSFIDNVEKYKVEMASLPLESEQAAAA